MTKKTPLSQRVEKETVSSGRKRRKKYTMDLRIQSPSALAYLGTQGIDTAPAMVRLAKVKGLDIIAITDFYSADFIDRVMEAASDSVVTVLPGVVIRCSIASCQDVVLTVLFPEDKRGEHITNFLHSLQIPAESFGDEKYLVQLEFDKILKVIERFEGICFPSRMDKTPYRKHAIRELVEDYGFRAFDLAHEDSKLFFKNHWPKIKFQLFSFSNAKALAQVGSRRSKVALPDVGFAGLQTVVQREALLNA